MKSLLAILSLSVFCLAWTPTFSQSGLLTDQVVIMRTKAEISGLPTVPISAQATLSGVAEPMQTSQSDFSAPTHLRECEGNKEKNPDVVRIKNQMEAEREEELMRLAETGTIPDPFEPNVSSVLSASPTMVFSSFNATNIGSGNPSDNTMAISNGGSIIVCVNSRVGVYTTTGSQVGVWDMGAFFNFGGSGVVNDFYDPSVIYDPGADRFVFTCSVGRQTANSRVCIAFSQSNNPAAGWWIFFLSGNPLNNGCWWDYPRLGVNESEVFITGNLYNNTGNYVNSVVYQISKTAGYAGSGFNYGVYSSLDGAPFALIPVSSGGNTNYGYSFYLVSHNPALGSSTKLYKVSNTYSSGLASILYTSVNVPAYSIGGNAGQQGSSEKLNTGDCRGMSAFYLNGLIHYVFHSKVSGSGTFNGLFYHRLDPVALSITSRTIYATAYDMVYPCVAWAGSAATDKSVVITFEYSTTGNHYPGIGAITVDDALNTSGSWTVCALGTSHVDLTGPGSGTSRWGDYTGICRKRNTSPARVWGCASFGNTNHTYTAKVYQLGINNFDGNMEERTDADQSMVAAEVGVRLYPNPAVPGTVQLDIEKPLPGGVEIEVISVTGQMMAYLQQDAVPPGHSQFQLPTEKLSAGTYFVRIRINRQPVRNEKLVILQ